MIGVSESSLKRWVDQGLINAVRTAGGHRKLAMEDVVRFLRQNNHPVVDPQVFQLPAVSPQSERGLKSGADRMLQALVAGHEDLARQIIIDLYLAKHGVAGICDQVMASAFHQIGEKWSCSEIDVYQERRGCEIALRVLYELRRVIPQGDPRFIAIGGTLQGDQYSIPPTMAELVVRDAGWHSVSLGTSLPVSSFLKAIDETKAQMLWLSVSNIADESSFLGDMRLISEATSRRGIALAVGGRALTEELRREMSYSAFCDTMQHLDHFARTLLSAAASAVAQPPQS